MKNQLALASRHEAWTGAKRINGETIGSGSHNGYDVEVYRAATGRITIRCYYWLTCQDASREGFLLDHRVSGETLRIAEGRARECGYPTPALVSAVSAAE